jgi:ketosteroid isomerase-like protein
MKRSATVFLLAAFIALSARAAGPGEALDAFHRAASEADLKAYFDLMTDDVVFLGTDGTERWQGQAFRQFVRPHFEAGRGWTYLPSARVVQLDSSGRVAWFDEVLHNDELGACRGSGVLVLESGQWKVAQYNLSVPIPNDLVLGVAAQIRGEPVSDAAGPTVTDDAEPSEGSAPAQEPEAAPCRKKRHKTNRAASC